MIYVSSACVKHRKIHDSIVEFAENGIKEIELSGGTDYYDELEADLVELRERYGLTYACHSYFPPPKEHFVVNLASPNDEIYGLSKKHYFDCIDMLSRIHIDVLSIHSGFFIDIKPEMLGKTIKEYEVGDMNKAYERFASAYEEISRKCKKEGIKLYLENNVISRDNYESFGYKNHFMMVDFSTIKKMRDYIDFNLLLDIAHLRVSCNAFDLNFETQINQLIPWAEWYHISDNGGVNDDHSPLSVGSKIANTAIMVAKKEKPITLETVGDIKQIMESISIIKNN